MKREFCDKCGVELTNSNRATSISFSTRIPGLAGGRNVTLRIDVTEHQNQFPWEIKPDFCEPCLKKILPMFLEGE